MVGHDGYLFGKLCYIHLPGRVHISGELKYRVKMGDLFLCGMSLVNGNPRYLYSLQIQSNLEPDGY